MSLSIVIELYAKKVYFIVCNLYLCKCDYREKNKNGKIPALKKSSKPIKIINSHLITKVKINIAFVILGSQLLCLIRNKALVSLDGSVG